MQNKKNNLTIGEVGEQSSGKEADEIQREILRNGRNDNAADNRDVAGSVDSEDTEQGRKEAKNEAENQEKSNDRQ